MVGTQNGKFGNNTSIPYLGDLKYKWQQILETQNILVKAIFLLK